MAHLTTEQSQTRFLAIVLPLLTLCTHTLLALSSILPGSDPDRAVFSFIYNILAVGASILGLIGAVRLLPSFLSIYTFLHTTTLSFATLALLTSPFPSLPHLIVNPVIPSLSVDSAALCQDIDAGMGWEQDWLATCAQGFSMLKWCVVGFGLILMVAQWWALVTVRNWGREIKGMRRWGGESVVVVGDVEKKGDDGWDR